MRSLAALVVLAAVSALAPAVAQQADPPDMAAAAKARSDDAPRALTRRSLGQVALPTYGTAKFRNVRAFYIRQGLINDQVIFCGELDAVIPDTKQRSGWTKFIYIPGDPTTLMTDTVGLGTREIGPQVRKRMCEDTQQIWLSGDYTAAFNKIPKVLAEAESAD
jgi:hypothetical protein